MEKKCVWISVYIYIYLTIIAISNVKKNWKLYFFVRVRRTTFVIFNALHEVSTFRSSVHVVPQQITSKQLLFCTYLYYENKSTGSFHNIIILNDVRSKWNLWHLIIRTKYITRYFKICSEMVPIHTPPRIRKSMSSHYIQ